METQWSPGNREMAKRWRVVSNLAWGAAALSLVAALFASAESSRKWALAVLAALFLVLQSFASSRARRHAPAPLLAGPELARYKVRLVVPGSRGGMPCWAIFDQA